MNSESWDVVVIGAGAAGLAAARELAHRGQRVLLLEARNRIGGRIWTCHEPHAGAPVELGAEFIHGDAPRTFEVLRSGGRGALEVTGEHWTAHRGKLELPREDLFGEIQRSLAGANSAGEPDISFDQLLSRLPHLSPEARALARSFVEGFDAADPERVSAASIIEEWAQGGMLDAPQLRPVEGYGALLAALAGALDRSCVQLQLRTAVTQVRWTRGRVEVRGSFLGEPFNASARRALITLPLGVLTMPAGEAGAVEFRPALEQKQAALEGLCFGAVLKVVLRFREAFWQTLDGGRYRNAAFFHSTDTVFPTFWTALPLRAPLINAWIGGPRAGRLSAESDDRIIRAALESLEGVFARPGMLRRQLEAAHLHNWQRDPHSRGAYSFVGVGAQSARDALAAPLLETLYFAGEATDTDGEPATVAGALNSGVRAARELCADSVRG